MEFTFAEKKSLRISVKTPLKKVSILNFFGHKDGSCFMSCPSKFLHTDYYNFGGIAMAPGVKKIKSIALSQENGFVKTQKEPKISFHASGYIHASLSSAEEIEWTRQVNMGKSLGELNGKTVAFLDWRNISQFEDTPALKEASFEVSLELETDVDKLMAFIKVGYSLTDILGSVLTDLGSGKQIAIDNDQFKKELLHLPEGKLIVLTEAFFTKWINPKIQLVLNEEEEPELKEIQYPVANILFGIKDNKVRKGEIIWFLLSFLNPKDTPQEIEKTYAGFYFQLGMKNWDARETREFGEMIVLNGVKKLE